MVGLKAKLAKHGRVCRVRRVLIFLVRQQTEEWFVWPGATSPASNRRLRLACVGQVKTGKVRLSVPGSTSPAVQRDTRTCFVGQGKDRESKIVWPGAPRRRPTRYRTCCVGQVKTDKVRCPWPGAPSPASNGRSRLAVLDR